METIRVKENNGKIIIRLKLNFDLWILAIIMAATLAGLIFFIIKLPEMLPEFIFFTCFFVIVSFFFCSWLWRGITINNKNETIIIYSFSIRKLAFDDISYCSIQLYQNEDTRDNSPYYPHLIFHKKKSYRTIKFRTRDEKQAQEIILLLSQALETKDKK